MLRLAADTIDFVNSFPAVIPDFDLRHARKVVINDQGDQRFMPTPSRDTGKIIVFIHCHYPDLLGYFTPYLNRIFDYDLIVTIVSPELENLVWEWAGTLIPNVNQHRRILIKCFPNIGRDVRTFWETGVGVSDEYTVFLKLHTKSSPQYKGFVGLLWLKDILENLLVDSSTIQHIASIIHTNKYGAVFPVPWRPLRYWGWATRNNLYHSEDVCKALSINPSILFNSLQYPVGNMYWGSTSIFRSYGERILSSLSWPEEPLPVDGTLLHSLERMTGYLYAAQQKKIAFSASIKSTARGEGLFTWDIEDLNNQHCDSCLPGKNNVNTSLLTEHFLVASSLACFSSGINSSIFTKKNILSKFSFSRFIRSILPYRRYVKVIPFHGIFFYSAPYFQRYTLFAFNAIRSNPFLNQGPATSLYLKWVTLCERTYSVFRVAKRIFCDKHN